MSRIAIARAALPVAALLAALPAAALPATAGAAPTTGAAHGLAGPPTPPAIAAAPYMNKRYDGRAPGGIRNYIDVNPDGSALEKYLFMVRVSCTDGKRRLLGRSEGGEAVTSIDEDGGFSGQGKPGRVRYGRESGIATDTVSGRFDPSGDSVTYIFNTRFDGRRFDCESGDVTVTLYRNGTPQAPHRTSRFFTGRYVARGKPGTAFYANVHAPSASFNLTRLRWVPRCRDRSNFVVRNRYDYRFITRAGKFSVSDSFTVRGRSVGGTARIRVRVAGRFYRARGRYRVRGTLASTLRFKSRRERLTCRVRSKFAGKGR